MKPLTLADEILNALPGLMVDHPEGPSIPQIARTLSADVTNARLAARQLNTDARADLMRRMDSREQFLVPLRYRKAVGLRYCAHCGNTFWLPPTRRSAGVLYYSNRRCCNRTCGIAWSWTRPGVRERRGAAIKASHSTTEQRERLAAHNRKRWSRPGERERLSEWNRQRWADPAIKAELSRAIAQVQRTPEMRKLYPDLRKEWWKDPAMRQKMCEAARRVKGTPEFRAYFSELCRKRWRDPVWRKKWLPAVRRNAAKAGRISQQKRRESRGAA